MRMSEEQAWGILMVQGLVVTICLIVGLLALFRVEGNGKHMEPSVAPAVSSNDRAGDEFCDLQIVECGSEAVAETIITKSDTRLRQQQPAQATHKSIERIVKKNASKSMQAKVDYAWEISKDKDFVLMIEAESAFNEHAVNINKDGSKDLGIMQINAKWHKKIVNDKNFKDWKWQIREGYKLYKGGTTFYGYHVRHKVANRFEYQPDKQ